MSDPSTLDTLRAEIDRLDTVIHDALMARTQVVARVAQAKRRDSGALGTGLRPDREAAIARRLSQRHSGAFPEASLQRIWREIVCVMTQIQVPFSAHLGGRDALLRDAARFAFGSGTDLVTHETASRALIAAGERESDIAVLPVGEDAGEAEPWWLAVPERAAVLMRAGTALVIGPRLDLEWDVPVAVVTPDCDALPVLDTAPDGRRLVAGDVASLPSACIIRPLGGYMDGPWLAPPI